MIQSISKLKSSFSLTLILIGFTLLVSDYNFRWKHEQWKYAVNTDAYYYYRYLPSIFINHRLDTEIENGRVIKYYVGTAIFELPFFCGAYVSSYILHKPLDGYSVLFPIFISIATLFYLMWGLFFFGKFLRFYSISDWVICVVVSALAFCTNAFYNTVMAPGWCHIIALGLVCFLLYHIKKLFVAFNKKSLLLIIVATSFLFFVRPTDVLILLIAPFLATDKINLLETIKKIFAEKKTIFIALLIAAIPLVCQVSIYKVHSGHFFVWSYTKEGFHFLNPEIKNVLFSYSKGLFVYTPISFISLFGLIQLYKINRFLFSGIIICLVVNIYIISSWWCWNYGYSFGARVFIEQYPVFFLPLAYLLNTKKRLLNIVLLSLICFCAFLNLFQTYQSEIGVLDKDFETTAKGYWHTFLRTDKGYSGKYFRFPVNESEENIVSRTVFFNDMEKKDTTWINTNTITSDKAFSGKYSSKANKNANFSAGIIKKISEIPYNRNVMIRVTGEFYVTSKGSNSFFAISFTNKGKAVDYCTYKMDGYIDNYGQWEEKVIEICMPKFNERLEKDASSQVEFYLFNDSDKDCFVDDLKIEFIEFKKLDRILDIDWD